MAGRTNCDVCSEDTIGEPVAIFHDPNRELGDQVRRIHVRHLFEGDLPKFLTELIGDWNYTINKHRKGFRVHIH